METPQGPPGPPPPHTPPPRLGRAIAVFNFVILLFPPLTWIVGQGGVWFFLISGVIGVLSLLVMYRVDASSEED